MSFTHKTWAKMSSLVMPKDAGEQDTGAGFVEYGAVIVFVGIIAAFLYSSDIGDLIVQGITGVISEIFANE